MECTKIIAYYDMESSSNLTKSICDYDNLIEITKPKTKHYKGSKTTFNLKSQTFTQGVVDVFRKWEAC